MRLTKQYAQALMKSVSKDEAVSIYYELLQVLQVIKAVPTYVNILEFQPEEFQTIRELLSETNHGNVVNFLEVLTNDGMLSQLNTIVEDYRISLIEENMLFDVKIMSAKPLEQAKKDEILVMIESRWSKNHDTNFVVKDNIIGGIRIEINGAVIDTTFRSRIDQIIREVRNGSK